MIDIDRLRELQKSIGVISTINPEGWDHLEIPQNLELSWKKFIEAKKELNEVLKTFNIDPVE